MHLRRPWIVKNRGRRQSSPDSGVFYQILACSSNFRRLSDEISRSYIGSTMAVAFEVGVSWVGALGSLMPFRASPEMMLFYYFICARTVAWRQGQIEGQYPRGSEPQALPLESIQVLTEDSSSLKGGLFLQNKEMVQGK